MIDASDLNNVHNKLLPRSIFKLWFSYIVCKKYFYS